MSGKRRKGGPNRRWMDSIKNDLTEKGLSNEQALRTRLHGCETSTPEGQIREHENREHALKREEIVINVNTILIDHRPDG